MRRFFVKIEFMKYTSKRVFFAAALAFAALIVPQKISALPGAASAVPDTSGEYVYYRDFSFNRESYIGFLYYDDSTYEARYYAPAAGSLPEKNIDMLFTAKQKNGRLELTGERFVVPPQQDDIEIVNYIHDLVYELSGRRVKLLEPPLFDYKKSAVPFAQAGAQVSDNYEAFGGSVQMIYDEAVPIFNLKKISDYSGKDIFVATTIGRIENSGDKSFAQFVPPPKNNDDKKAPAQIKSAKKETLENRVEIGKNSALVQSAQADKNWSLAGQNVWTLGDSAILSMQTMGLPQDDALGQAKTVARLLRFLASSKNGAYCDWKNLDVHASGSSLKINAPTYNPKSKKLITDIKLLKGAAPNLCGCLSLAVYSDDFQANRGYFDKIVKSYSCKLEQ